jgi:ribonuclease HII
MAGYELGEIEERFPELLVVGVDEVGVGTLAGPVAAGAVALDLLLPTHGINDSKKLSEAKRERMHGKITREAIAWSVAKVSSTDVDRLGIARASNKAKRDALVSVLEALMLKAGGVEIIVAVDGENEITGHPILRGVRQLTFVKGDQRSWSVAAASIVAKHDRDQWMIGVAHRKWPQYGFRSHKGYGTQRHMEMLLRHGPCEIHRHSFKLIKEMEG